MAVTAAQLLVKVGADTTEATQSIQSFRSGLNQTAADLGRSGASLTAGITTPLVGAGVAALKFSTDFNAAMANVASLGLAPERVLELKGNIQDMALEVGKSTGDLADGMYQVVSAFGDSSDSLEILEINARAAAAGLATTTDAINLTSAVTKGYGDTSAEALQHVADLAFKTVEMGQTTFPELASSMGKVVPLAVELGISQEELFAVMATGTGVTGNASEVVTQLRSSMQALMSPTGSMTDLIEEMGFASGKAMVEQLGYHGSILAITQAAEATGKPLGDFMGRVEGQVLALALAGPQADVYTEKLAAMGNAAGAVDDAFRAQTEGINATGFAMRNAAIRGEIFMQKMGDGIAPAIDRVISLAEPLVGWVEGLVDTFTRADEGTQLMVVGLAAFAAAIGPVMLGLAGMAAALAFLLTPIGAIVAAVGLLGTAFITDFGGIRTITMQVFDAISAFATQAADVLDASISFINTRFQEGLAGGQEFLARIPEWMQPAVVALGQGADAVGTLVDNFNRARTDGLNPFAAAIAALQISLQSWNMQGASDALGDFETAIGTALTAVQNFVDSVATAFSNTTFPSLETLWEQFKVGDFETIATTIRDTAFELMVNLDAELNISGTANNLKETLLNSLADAVSGLSNFDWSSVTLDMSGLRTALIQEFALVDFAVIGVGLRWKLQGALNEISWDDIKVGADDLKQAIIRQLADVDFAQIATGLRLKVTKAFQDLTWDGITVGDGDLQGAIIRQLADVNFSVIAIGLKWKLQGALGDITWDDIKIGDGDLKGAIIRQLAEVDFGVIATGLKFKVQGAFQDLTWENITLNADDLRQTVIQQVESLRDDIISGLTDAIGTVDWSASATAFTSMVDGLTEAVNSIDFSDIDWVEFVTSKIMGPVGLAIRGIEWVLESDQMAGLVTAVNNAIRAIEWGELLDSFGGLAVAVNTQLGNVFADMASDVADAISDIDWTQASIDMAGLIDSLTEQIDSIDWSSMGANLVTNIKSALEGMIASDTSIADTLRTSIADAFNSIDWGGIWTAADQLEASIKTAVAQLLTGMFAQLGAEGSKIEFTQPAWLESLLAFEITQPAWLTSLLEWGMPPPSELLEWVFPPPSALLEWLFPPPTDLISWKFPPPMQLLSWAFPAPFALLAWVWPSLPTWTWPAIPRPAWLDSLINWRPPAIELPGGGGGGGTTYGFDANGRSHTAGGWGWIGERGPELVRLPRGSTIYPHEQSMAMAGGGDVHVHMGQVTIANNMDIHMVANEVARIIKNHRRG